ncbi:MAG: hypothetical protein IPP28_00080 [Xanthomonadales bacterium]|nr:hypothetical protein [Xanthomonadales bacterium]
MAVTASNRSRASIALAREHRVGRRVLIVDATTPHPDEDSGSVRMVNLMQLLVALGARSASSPRTARSTAAIRKRCSSSASRSLYHPVDARADALAARERCAVRCGDPESPLRRPPLLQAVRHYAPQATSVRYRRPALPAREREAALADREDLRRPGDASTKLAELRLIRQSDVTLVVSPVRQELLQREVPGARIEVLSNVHKWSAFAPASEQREDLFFVGGFSINRTSMRCCGSCMRSGRWSRRHCRTRASHIVGSRMPDAIRALSPAARVIVPVFLPSLDEMLDGCRLSWRRCTTDAGVKARSAEHGAWSTGRRDHGRRRRHDLKHEVDVLVADDAEAFAREIIRSLHRRPSGPSSPTAPLANIATHFSFAAATQALKRVLG